MKYRELMVQVNNLRDKIKERSRIFDVSGKEDVARAFHVRFDTFYDLPYTLWSAQATRLKEKLDAMSRDIDDVETWCGQNLHKTAYCDWYHIYDDWLSDM
jgi:hypothetical protein